MTIPMDRLVHIGLVVKDARASARKLARAYGISQWRVIEAGDRRLSNAATHGFASPHSYRMAIGAATTGEGPVNFLLIQPTGGWSSFQQFLLTRGEGIHHVCTASIGDDALAEVRSWLKSENVAVAQDAVLDGALSFTIFDTRDKLGGFHIALLGGAEAHSIADLDADEIWDMSADLEAGGPLVPLTDLRHFGVVVDDLMDRVQNWGRLFGHTSWQFRHWRDEPGSLDDPTYLGAPVHHAYFTTMVSLAPLLTFEIIQPTFGPSHYKEDYLQPLGEGIHHLFTTNLPDQASWNQVRDRAAAAGVPVVMSGGLGNGFLHFYYLDTREILPGYVTEALHPGNNFSPDRKPNLEVAMTAELIPAG